MRKFCLSFVVLICLLTPIAVFSQSGKGVIEGLVKDPAGAVLHGAKIEMKPQLRPSGSSTAARSTWCSASIITRPTRAEFAGTSAANSWEEVKK